MPRWWTQFWYVTRRLDALIADLVTDAGTGPGATIVDYGCGAQPYRTRFHGCEYIGVDLPDNPNAAVHISPEGKVPVADGSTDLVLSTQVLEHVGDPETYLSECNRMLVPGGNLVLTTHGVMYLHRVPTDFWRWTCDGLRLAVERAGFEVVDQRGVMTLSAASLQLMQYHYLTKARSTMRMRLICALFQGLIAYTDRRGSEQDRRDNGFVLAVRAVKRPPGPATVA